MSGARKGSAGHAGKAGTSIAHHVGVRGVSLEHSCHNGASKNDDDGIKGHRRLLPLASASVTCLLCHATHLRDAQEIQSCYQGSSNSALCVTVAPYGRVHRDIASSA